MLNERHTAGGPDVTPSVALLLARGDVDGLLAFQRSRFGEARMDGTGSGEGGSGSGSGGSGDGGAGGSGDGGAGGGQGSGGGGGSGTISQDEANRAAARARDEGRRTAIKEILGSLAEAAGAENITSTEAAVDFVRKAKEREDAAKTDEQKRLDELTERERKAEERDRAAAERERQASIREALAEAGSTGQELKDAAVLIAAGLDANADAAAITTAVDELKKRRAELFKGTAAGAAGTHTDTGSGGGGGAGGGNGSGGKTSSAKLAEGAKRAQEFGLIKGEKQTA